MPQIQSELSIYVRKHNNILIVKLQAFQGKSNKAILVNLPCIFTSGRNKKR